MLTNGQVADASEVMDNFNAVAACVNDVADALDDTAVTQTGTPQAGAIAVFSAPQSVTNGDLSGDVTTSGSTATTLATTGVTAGSYINPNITVDAKGRITAVSSGSGGGGGGGGGTTSMRVTLGGTQALAASTYTLVQFDTVAFGSLTGLWAGSPTYAFVIPDGLNRAEVVASAGVTSTDLSGYWHLLIQKNGASVAENASSSDFYGIGIVETGVFAVEQGDQIKFVIRSSGNKSIGTSTVDPFMSIKLWAE